MSKKYYEKLLSDIRKCKKILYIYIYIKTKAFCRFMYIL